MTTIRIGNDLPLKWSFYYRDSQGQLQPYSLVGKTLQLVMTDPLLKETVIASPTVASNYLQWTFRGKDQKRIGKYSFSLYENRGSNGMHAVDKVCPLSLVPVQEVTASGVTQSGTSVLEVSPVELSTELGVIGSKWGYIIGNLSDQTDLSFAMAEKQELLVSGTNIKTIEGESILGAGSITITHPVTDVRTGDGSVLSQGVATIPDAGSAARGVLKVSSSYGVTVSGGQLMARERTTGQYDAGSVGMIVGKGTLEHILDERIVRADKQQALTASQKTQARNNISAEEALTWATKAELDAVIDSIL